jgi:hypothetical protein
MISIHTDLGETKIFGFTHTHKESEMTVAREHVIVFSQVCEYKSFILTWETKILVSCTRTKSQK